MIVADPCPEENELLDLVSGKPLARAVASHVANCPTCSLVLADAFGTYDAPALAPGATLGRYRIIGEIGRGGAGTVYEALDELLDRTVAIKVLRRSSAEARARLLREARLIARLDHRNVVAIFDAGESDDTLYFAMELVRGHSLRDLIAGRAPARDVLAVMCDAGRGLAAAHRAGIVHRDFKPANVLVAETGRTVVVDFGLASAELSVPERPGAAIGATPVDDRLTMTGQVFGTPAYMPPEQIAGRATDAGSDQFAFCASLVHALTGTLPFRGATLAELRDEIERGHLDATALTALPLFIRRVVIRGLHADPARRFPSMDALLARLDRRSRLARVAVAAFVVGGAVAGGYLARGSTPPSDPCITSAGLASELWTPARRGAITRSLATLPAADVDGVTTSIGAWTERWRIDREATCRAAAPGVDPRADREALCLDGQLVDLGATLDVLATIDARTARMAPHAVTALPAVARCHGAKPAPLDPAPRTARAERTRRRLALLAAIDARGGATLTVLAGTPDAGNRLYTLALPSTHTSNNLALPYASDLWELRALGEREALSFDRKLDTLVTIDRRRGTVLRALRVSADVHNNGRGLAISPTGAIVALAKGRTLVQLDPQTGEAQELSTLDPAWQLETMTYCPDGTLYAAGTTGSAAAGRTLVTLDPARGAVTAIGPIGADAIDIDTLACDRDGALYGLDTINVETNDVYAIDPRTGIRSLLATIPGPVGGLVVE
jgi:Protein kinase domain